VYGSSEGRIAAKRSIGEPDGSHSAPVSARLEFDHPEGRIVLVAMLEFSAWVAAADAIERASIGDSFYLALFTGQRQTDRLIMRDESDVAGRHAFRQSKTGELVDIKEAPQLSARLNASRARARPLSLGSAQLYSLPRLAPIETSQCEHDLAGLAPKRGFIAAQPIEGIGWQVGQADKGVRELVRLVGKRLGRGRAVRGKVIRIRS
jgi:hypothetical protein